MPVRPALQAALLVLGLLPSLAFATVHFDEQFSDGDRRNQDLPGSAAWFTSQAAAIQRIENGLLSLRPPNPEQALHLVAHIQPTALAPGKPLKLTIDFTPVSLGEGSRHGLRVGLFNSNGGTPFTADTQNPYLDYTGYAFSINPVPSGSPSLVAYRRVAGKRGRLLTNNGGYEKAGEGGSVQPLQAGQRYRLTFEISPGRGDNVSLRLTIDGPGLRRHSINVNSPAVTTGFDTIGLSLFQSISELHIHRIQLAD